MTAPMPDGTYAEKAIKKALSEAEIKPEHIDLICAHGTGTPLNDDAESAIIGRIFENKIPPVTALKSWIGHGAAACGALELAISIICQRNNFMPYIKNLENPCNDSINFIKNSIDRIFDYMLLLNFGFGGQNSALVIQSYKD
jgi:3-oxoacyl-[acyl-carrier-protein] synthase II